MRDQKRVFVGLSGGVDSSVSALLLKNQGYQVEGVFMKNWEDDGKSAFCPQDIDLKDAKAVCEKLAIPFHRVSFAQEYWETVFQYFLNEYAAGRTPNPDILCNKEIKFGAFLNYALSQGADYIATGHYAKIATQEIGEKYLLKKATDLNKDQTYFLYTLQQHQLAKSLFPLAALKKPTVRKIAQENGFDNFAKKDSTGICFIGERKFSDFLGEYLLARPGNIETIDGKVIGKHRGLMFYTLGQRQGLGIGGQKALSEAAWYVIDKDIARQVLVVGQSHDHPKLLSRSLICEQLHWIAGAPPETPLNCAAKTRYRQIDAPCILQQKTETHYEVVFETAQWAITPGQSVVFYHADICLGGGVIV